jgi:hypothetical protein
VAPEGGAIAIVGREERRKKMTKLRAGKDLLVVAERGAWIEVLVGRIVEVDVEAEAAAAETKILIKNPMLQRAQVVAEEEEEEEIIVVVEEARVMIEHHLVEEVIGIMTIIGAMTIVPVAVAMIIGVPELLL